MKFNAKQRRKLKGVCWNHTKTLPPNYFLMNYNDDNGLNPNTRYKQSFFLPVIILQFKNHNQKQSYLAIYNLHCFHTFTLVLHTLMLTKDFQKIGPDTYITITQKGEDLSKEFLNGYRFGWVQNELTYTSLEALIFNQIIIKESIEQNIWIGNTCSNYRVRVSLFIKFSI